MRLVEVVTLVYICIEVLKTKAQHVFWGRDWCLFHGLGLGQIDFSFFQRKKENFPLPKGNLELDRDI